jgi:hypothetical protein
MEEESNNQFIAEVSYVYRPALIKSFHSFGIFSICSTIFYSFCIKFYVILRRLILLIQEVVDIKAQAISTHVVQHS